MDYKYKCLRCGEKISPLFFPSSLQVIYCEYCYKTIIEFIEYAFMRKQKMSKKSTMVELVQELEKLPKTPTIEEIIREAKAGEYHDYKNQKYVCGKVESSRKLRAAGLIDLAKQIENGDYDEEADEQDKEQLKKDFPEFIKILKL